MTTPSASSPGLPEPLFVGIDVAKLALDVARSDSAELLHVANDPAGFKTIIARLASATPACIVIEATGGLEQPLLDALLDAGLPVARVNPGRVRHLAMGLGILAKTDAIDARVLVEFARKANPRLAVKRLQIQVQLDDLVTCRRQLVETKTQTDNRLKTTPSKPAQKAIAAVLHTLDKQITSLNKQINTLIDSDDDFKHLHTLLRSVPGVGPGLGATLLAELHELGQTDRQKLAALVGVAPYNKDSGMKSGKRAVRGGRVHLRCMLYMATMSAIRHNPVIKTFADHLREKAKPGKVILVACMRKLLSLLNAMVRDNLSWHQLHVVKQLQTMPQPTPVTNAQIA